MDESHKEIIERLQRIEDLLLANQTDSDEIESFSITDETEGDENDDFDFELLDFSLESNLSEFDAFVAEQFGIFIDHLNFKHFKGSEFEKFWGRRHSQGAINTPPSSDLWPNIVKTLAVLDHFREDYGHEVIINSSYRNKKYNKAVKGKSRSQHLICGAIDFKVVKGKSKDWAKILKSYRGKTFKNPMTGKDFKFHGGIGIYCTFVHLDTRGEDVNFFGKGVKK